MAIDKFELVDPPDAPQARELWLQHAFGFVVAEDVRSAVLEEFRRDAHPAHEAAVERAVDATIYRFMMLFDGVTGGLRNSERRIEADLILRLRRGDVIEDELRVADGDGLCMGVHEWFAGEFGEHPVATRRGTNVG